MEKTWTTQEFNQEVERHYKEMKQYGFTKADCKRDIKNVMTAEGITIRNTKN